MIRHDTDRRLNSKISHNAYRRADKFDETIGKLTPSHFDIEILANQGEQSGSEVHLQVHVHRHVHPDELLIGKPVWTFVTKPQRWIHVLEHVVHLGVMDLARCVWIVFGPDPDELVQVMSAQDRRVSR